MDSAVQEFLPPHHMPTVADALSMLEHKYSNVKRKFQNA